MLKEQDETQTHTEASKSAQQPVVMWLKENLVFSALTLAGMMPLIIFLDTAMGIMLFRDYGELKGMAFIFFVVFYAEFTKKYRDT